MKAYFDENKVLIGLSDELNPLSEISKELNEEEYKSIIEAINQEIKLADDNTLLFKEKPPEVPPAIMELQKLEVLNKQQEILEKQKQEMFLTNMEILEQIILELLPGINLTGGETMLITLLVNNIIIGKITYSQVPEVLKPRVKEMLVSMGLDFLVIE